MGNCPRLRGSEPTARRERALSVIDTAIEEMIPLIGSGRAATGRAGLYYRAHFETVRYNRIRSPARR